MDRALYRQLEARMLHMREDSAHDRQHIYRVLYNALDIAATESAVDMDVLIAACLLHDIGREAQFTDPTLCHAREGARMARAFLLQIGREDLAEPVAQAVLTHRYRSDNPPASLEAKILFDADKLDVTGAIGVARTLLYDGHVGSPLYGVGPDNRPLPGDKREPESFVREYNRKLKGIYEHFYTRRGAELARQRQRHAQAFYETLMLEIDAAQGQSLLEAWLDG